MSDPTNNYRFKLTATVNNRRVGETTVCGYGDTPLGVASDLLQPAMHMSEREDPEFRNFAVYEWNGYRYEHRGVFAEMVKIIENLEIWGCRVASVSIPRNSIIVEIAQ